MCGVGSVVQQGSSTMMQILKSKIKLSCAPHTHTQVVPVGRRTCVCAHALTAIYHWDITLLHHIFHIKKFIGCFCRLLYNTHTPDH